MRPDFEIIRFRFLIVGFLALFFVIGAVRYAIVKIKGFNRPEVVILKGDFPSGSLGAQIQGAQKRSKHGY